MEALHRIYQPGCKVDEMLVWQVNRERVNPLFSGYCRLLVLDDDWFSDDLRNLGNNKIYEHLRGQWIIEMPEMVATISARNQEILAVEMS